ncbi:MAG: LysM peptidoglycan-binding domain-containing protein, partial [Chloroflexi bacterium]|nr:LysM peptidoglycan-binding domain-containing protein [Chloroflexota bacterium]
MDSRRQISEGFLLGGISIIVILGAFALSLAEGGIAKSLPPTVEFKPVIQTVTPVIIPTSIPTISTQTNTPLPIIVATSTETPAQTATAIPSNTTLSTSAACVHPTGWVSIVLQASDSLSSLAQTYQVTTTSIKQGNCLASDQLVSGSVLYVPAKSSASATNCGAPVGWINYYVVSGDTLYDLSVRYRSTIAELQRANCLGTTTLQVGKLLKVPNVAPIANTPTSVWTASATPVILPTATLSPPATATTAPPPTDVPPPTSTIV